MHVKIDPHPFLPFTRELSGSDLNTAAVKKRSPDYEPVRGAELRLRSPLRVGHQTEHVALGVADTGYVLGRAVGIELGQDTSLRSEEHTSELQSRFDLVCRLLL